MFENCSSQHISSNFFFHQDSPLCVCFHKKKFLLLSMILIILLCIFSVGQYGRMTLFCKQYKKILTYVFLRGEERRFFLTIYCFPSLTYLLFPFPTLVFNTVLNFLSYLDFLIINNNIPQKSRFTKNLVPQSNGFYKHILNLQLLSKVHI